MRQVKMRRVLSRICLRSEAHDSNLCPRFSARYSAAKRDPRALCMGCCDTVCAGCSRSRDGVMGGPGWMAIRAVGWYGWRDGCDGWHVCASTIF